MSMKLSELMTIAGTDPDRINAMPESELRSYLEPLFPAARPSVQRVEAVEKAAKVRKAADTLKALDLFDTLRNKKL